MRILMLFICFVLNLLSITTAKAQPWVEENAIWKYRFEDQSLGGEWGLIKIYKTGNVMHNGFLCDELVSKKYTYTYTGSWQISDSIILDTNYTYLSSTGDSVLYEQDGVFRVLYDFSADVGDSLLIHVTTESGNFGCDDSSYAFISSNTITNISGINYRTQTVGKSSGWNDKYTLGSYPIGFGDGINERFGAIQYDVDGYLFPVREGNCFPESLLFRFLCFFDDSLAYDLDCDYFETLKISNIENPKVTIYPNPFHADIVINGLHSIANIYIYDILGQVVKRIEPEELPTVNLSELECGVYWLIYSESSTNNTLIKIIKL